MENGQDIWGDTMNWFLVQNVYWIQDRNITSDVVFRILTSSWGFFSTQIANTTSA